MEKLKNPNWIIHAVSADNPETDGYTINYHTHGLAIHGQPELMIALPIEGCHVGGLINSIGVKLINDGITLESGQKYDCFLQNGYHIKVKKINYNGGESNLILLPDEQDKFPGEEECSKIYNMQEKMCEAFIAKEEAIRLHQI